MTATDVDTANRELNVPKIKDRTKKEVNEKIAALKLSRVRHARSLQPDGAEVGEYVADFSDSDVGDEEPVPVSKKESRKRLRTPVSSEEDFEEEDYEVGDCDADDLFDDEASEPSEDSFSPRLPKKRFRSLYDDEDE